MSSDAYDNYLSREKEHAKQISTLEARVKKLEECLKESVTHTAIVLRGKLESEAKVKELEKRLRLDATICKQCKNGEQPTEHNKGK